MLTSINPNNFRAGLRVARISTVAFFVETQLKRQIEGMVESGMIVSVIASEPRLQKPIKDVVYKSIKIPREISLICDLVAIFELYCFFRSSGFDIVHSTTPKAGLLTAIAAYIAKVPVRVHTYTGQVWVEKKGVVRLLAKWSDKIINILNTQCYADSPSQVDFLLRNRIVSDRKIKCLGYGSLAGVDLKRFNPTIYSASDRESILSEIGIRQDSKVLIFIGRFTRDKGVVELIKSFEQVLKVMPDVNLLVVGPVEDSELAKLGFVTNATKIKVRFIAHTAEPEKYLSISDLLLLPSYREGFGTVVIEAAAIGIPAIGTRIYGLQDAIVDNKTGCLVEPKNVEELTVGILSLLSDDKLRHGYGTAALERVKQSFSNTYVNQLLFAEYQRLAISSGITR